jgi:hypothetical protein
MANKNVDFIVTSFWHHFLCLPLTTLIELVPQLMRPQIPQENQMWVLEQNNEKIKELGHNP